jgi:nuclear pore complex protein Nup54
LQQMWEEGRGLGVYRSIPAQMNVVKDKWDAATLVSPLRAYLYQHVGDEKEALRYRPGPGEDEDKWEDAIQKRPGGEWVPLLVRGFMEMGGKVKQQGEALARCNMMLQEINNSLNLQLEMHQQKVAARLAECKRRQQATSRRILALAVKVQILRNKGYVMDNAEEELKVKLEKLEKDVLDPSLDAREQEIWARMLGIRERAKRLKTEMDKLAPMAAAEEPALDEGTIKTAKQVYPLTWSTVQSLTSSQILEAYDTQLRHLQKELQLVQQEYEDWQKLSKAQDSEPLRRR